MRRYNIIILILLFCDSLTFQPKTPKKKSLCCIESMRDKLSPKRGIQHEHLASKNESKEKYLLPKTVLPESYNISIACPMRSDFKFNGVVRIKIAVINSTNEISLHYAKMTIRACRIYDKNNNELRITNVKYTNVSEIFTLVLEKYIDRKTNVLIIIHYEAALADDFNGFFKDSYYDIRNRRRWLAATNMHPVYARRVFPSFDEPSFKAKFILNICRPKHLVALSNMPKMYTQQFNNDFETDTFAESPKMSASSVSIVISDFSSMTLNGSSVSIWSRNSVIRYGNFALHFATTVLNEIKNLFNLMIPIPKFDFVAIPNHYLDATGTWGLLLIKEEYLLYDVKENDEIALRNVGQAISRQLARMWFGNLISPESWEFRWLGDSFAEYFSHVGSLMARPSWKTGGTFLINVRSSLSKDTYETEPISRPYNSLAEIKQMSDSITYNKGSSIVRMMAESFGPDIFYEALLDYLHRYKCSNVVPNYLWDSLQKQVNQSGMHLTVSVKNLLTNWINLAGYPTLFVNVAKDQIELRQGSHVGGSGSSQLWYIPVTYTVEKTANFSSAMTTTWMTNNMTIQVSNATEQWIVFNILGAGFYRVNYDRKSWYRIIRALNSRGFKKIHEFNRVVVLDDLFELAKSHNLSYNVVLDATEYLRYERNYLPLKVAFQHLRNLRDKFSGHEDEQLLNNHILNLLENVYKRVGYFDKKNDNSYAILLRMHLNDIACYLHHLGCLKNAVRTFQDWKKDPSKKIRKNQFKHICCYAIQEGSTDDWEFLNKQYKKTDNVGVRLDILHSLACTNSSDLLNRLMLETIISGHSQNLTITHKKNGLQLIYRIAKNGIHQANFTLNFIVNHYDKLLSLVESEDDIISIIAHATYSVTTQDRIDQFKKYIVENGKLFASILPELKIILKGTISSLNNFKQDSMDIKDWLYKKYPYI